MKKLMLCLFVFLSLIVHSQNLDIIPKPAEIKLLNNPAFKLTEKTKIVIEGKSTELKKCSDYLNQYLKKTYGITLQVVTSYPSNKNYIGLEILPPPMEMDTKNVHEKSYSLSVEQMITLASEDYEGIFEGIQTFIQLLPIKVSRPFTATIPSVYISDYPKFPYRGMHLDVGRHFFSVSFIKKYIDYLTLHKFNYFHWHLTEDQGWRIEIKKYPNLTKTGAWRNGTIIGRYPGTANDNTRHGGFYTQQQVKEIVKYAADRFITVIPEIEMPGHSSAAIASYPWLSCFPDEKTIVPANMMSKKSKEEQAKGRKKLVQESWGVFDDVFCAGKNSTFTFLENVLNEVIALFPSKYIHIGGDESPKNNWKRCPLCQKRIKDENLKDEHELQSYFIRRIEKYLNSKGRSIIGWDEILEGGLAPNATVMSWRGEEGGIAAARQNHKVIMTPGGWCYLDHSQSQNEDSVTIGSYLPIEKVYSYNPLPDSLNDEQKKFILGAQGNVWTEYMSNPRKVEYMIFPRIAALSEVLWSEKKDSTSFFERRLLTQFKRYDLWKVNYSKAYFELRSAVVPTENNDGLKWQVTKKNKDEILFHYTRPVRAGKTTDTLPIWDKNDPTKIVRYEVIKPGQVYNYTSTLRSAAENQNKIFDVNETGDYLIEAYHFINGVQTGGPFTTLKQTFHFNKATGKKVVLATPPSKNYPGDGAFTLVNGVWNEKWLNKSSEFIAFNGGDCEATIDLGSVQQISNVKAHVFEQTPSWIWRPKYFQVSVSQDDKTYTDIGTTDVVQFTDAANRNALMTIQKSVSARYIKIHLGNYGPIPEGNPGANSKPWLFVDEIEVN